MNDFTHIDKNNKPCMVDVSEKKTTRFAHAQGKVFLPEVIRKNFEGKELYSKKGPVFQTAIISATMALKKTAELIPFCHQISIESCSVDIALVGEEVVID